MLEPVIHTIEVPCNQQQAYEVFLQMGSWWPLDQRSMSLMKGGQPAKSLRVDIKEGGKIMEIAPDDSEILWGTINKLEPHGYLSLDFHMGMPPETASLVEVRFTSRGAHRTEVELSQSNWEAFGDMAGMMRNGYGASWPLLFEQAYKEACGG